MDALTQQLLQQLSGGGLSKIGQQIGADEQTTGSALSTAVPLLVSALAGNAAKPKGAKSLHKALAKDHDGSILDDTSGYLDNPQAADGAAILGHILGGKQPAVTQGLARNTGLDGGQAGQLLEIAAPLLMGALGQQQRQQGLNTKGLSSFLGGQKEEDEKSDPDMMSTLNSLLDTNKSGSALDEVLGTVGKLFGGK